ncbi:MAG: HNH endonuclease [Phycisphaerales bacterium]|nr:HNH endonuclease [Phycisphaerales bacterium]
MKKKTRSPGARTKLRTYFEANVGKIMTSAELHEVANGTSEWARRVRELRNEEGMQILTHNDRDSLAPGEYLIETLTRLPVISRGISGKMRLYILDRNGFTCQVCGAGAGEESGCELGKKCRLQIDHTVPISQGGTDDENNLRAVCVGYNKDKSNLKVSTSRDAISVMVLLRRQPRDVQLEIYQFLKKKFGDK